MRSSLAALVLLPWREKGEDVEDSRRGNYLRMSPAIVECAVLR